MSDRVLRLSAASALAAALIFGAVPASAQSGDPKAAEKPKAQTGNPGQGRRSKKAEELADTAKAISGPAGNPECVWLGRRVVNLLWRDDLDTAFRHLDLYDRFGCPSGHIQATFRCVVRQGRDRSESAGILERARAGLLDQSGNPACASCCSAKSGGSDRNFHAVAELYFVLVG